MDFKALYKLRIITTAKGGLTTVPFAPWGLTSPGFSVWVAVFYALWLPVLFYFHDVVITQFACCELIQHDFLRVHDEKMYRIRHWQFVIISSNIGGLHGAGPGPHGIWHEPPQNCPWVGLTNGFGWAALGWVEIFQLFVVWVGSSIAKVLKFERIMLMHLIRGCIRFGCTKQLIKSVSCIGLGWLGSKIFHL